MSTGERTTAETLLAAAARLREIAARATPGPWDYDRFEEAAPWEVIAPSGDDLEDVAVCSAENGRVEANAWWIATVHPGIAEPLAQLLEIEAATARVGFEDYEDYYPATVAVARLILGEIPGAAS
jgi:hypothetical protein